MGILTVIFESKIFSIFYNLVFLYLIMGMFSGIQDQIRCDKGLRKKQNLSLVVFFVSLLLFTLSVKEFGLVTFENIVPGVLTILSWKVFFLSKEKEYQNLRRKTFFDENGNYLLKKGVETRYPL